MRKCLISLLALTVLSVLIFGCARTSKDKRVICPKCGAFFSTKEGVEEFKRFQAYPPER
jgi:hypothetical protein